MHVTIDVERDDAAVFTDMLNMDAGFREASVQKLLQQNKSAGIERLTAFVTVLGRISRGFVQALEGEGIIDLASRRREIRKLAQIDRKAA